MPPKKDNKKESAQADNSGIPKEDVQFKFSFSIECGEQLPQTAIMYEWFAGNDKFERYDCGLTESWTKKEDGKYEFEKSFDSVRIDDDFCKNLSKHQFFVYFVHPQTSNVEESLILDYSSLLMYKGEQSHEFNFQSKTIKVQNVDSFSMKLTASRQLLTDKHRQYLNPMEVQVIGALNVPQDSSLDKYVPSYVKYTFYDGSVVQTNPIVGSEKLIWQHKHVFLVGIINPIELKEKIRSTYMKFQFHDRDEVKNNNLKEDVELFDIEKAIEEELLKEEPVEEDPKKKGAKKQDKKETKKDTKKDTKKKDAKLAEPILPPKPEILSNNHGVAVFSLVEFLSSAVRTAKYKSPVIPQTKFEDYQSRNIDLNTTSRNLMQKILFSNNYFDNDTTLVVGFTISHPIGEFIKKEGSKSKQPIENEAVVQIGSELKQEKNDFERVVVILPYKDKENVEKIEQIFYDTNLQAFNLKNKRQITTYVLKDDEKNSHEIDYLSGIQIIDPEGRLYILQGLKNKALDKIYSALPKDKFSSSKQKILKNKNVLYSERLYKDFNIELKRIRLRPSLSQILLSPSIYIKSKVDEEINKNLNRMSDLRGLCDDLATVDMMNLWPQTDILVQIERKYSQSLSFEDLHAEKEKKVKKSSKRQELNEFKNIEFFEPESGNFNTASEFYGRKQGEQTQQIDKKAQETKDDFGKTKKDVHTKTVIRDQMAQPKYGMRLEAANVPKNEPVYIYASQKLNWYDRQNREMRQKIDSDKKFVYTMSKDYLSQSIDPRDVKDELNKEMQLSQTKNYSQQKFSSLLVKTKEQRLRLTKKPGDQDIEDLLKYPYHENKQRELEIKKSQRDKPLNNGKEDFKKYIKKKQIFSQPEVLEVEKMARVAEEKMLKEQRLRREEEERQKLKGDPYIKVKKGYTSDKVSGIDKFDNILEGSPNKKGIIDVHKKSKTKRPVQNYEVSLFLNEQKTNPAFNPLVRVDDETLNVAAHQFNYYQKPEVLTSTGIYKPLKKN